MTEGTITSIDPAHVLDAAIEALKLPGAELPLDDVERAIRIVPHDARLWHVKGLILRAQDRRELAIPALKEAVRLAPSEPLIIHGYARTLLEAGLPSVDEFGRALKLNPNDPAIIKGLVSALVAVGRSEDAIEGLEMAVRRSPLWTDGHTLLASLRWAHGERDQFARSFDEALTQHPNSLELRREQLAALVNAGAYDEALGQAEQGARLFANQLMFSMYGAAILSERGDVEAADPLFAQLAALRVADIDVWRVRHLLRSGRAQDASQAIDSWLETPDQFRFWHYAASTWRLTGDPRSDWLEGDRRLVGEYDLADRLPPLDRVAEILRSLHISNSELLAQSVRGGTQTDGNLFYRIEPEIIALREAVRQTVQEHAAQLSPADNAHPTLRWRPDRPQFTGAWSVRLQAGGSHANHVHPMGWFSSALYIVLPPDLGREHSGWLTLGEPQAELGLNLPPHRLIEPRPGRLALFPSWMWHGTRPFAEGERITVAFDVAPV